MRVLTAARVTARQGAQVWQRRVASSCSAHAPVRGSVCRGLVVAHGLRRVSASQSQSRGRRNHVRALPATPSGKELVADNELTITKARPSV